MTRPSFALTDDQARVLATRVATLVVQYPRDANNHRPFVRAFMRAVHEATGQLYGPSIYHRLLAAFAPDRRPSTATLASEKALMAGQLASSPASMSGASVDLAANAGTAMQLQALIADAINAGLARATHPTAQVNATRLDFYEARLREAELQLVAARADNAALTAELAIALQSAQQQSQETARVTATLQRQTEIVATLTSEVTEHRKFALQSIEEARGESRAWKERSAWLEAQRQLDARLMETFRQLAYQRGAAIPSPLLQDKNK